MDYRDLVLLQTYLTCASNSVFEGTHPVLKARACGMINALAGQGFLESSNPSDVVSQGYRTPEDAHRMSTAYHAAYGYITREQLQKDPTDLDGNDWYLREWIIGCGQSRNPEYCFMVEIANNALCNVLGRDQSNAVRERFTPWGSDYSLAYAQEGYPSGDPRRLPNSDDVPVSNHVSGLAVDIWGWWSDNTNDIWGSQITNIARQFRLGRPFTEEYVERENARLRERGAGTQLQAEYWHFEPIDIERYR